MSNATMTPDAALALLRELGAVPWLVRHHELVLEAAVALCDRVRKGFAKLAFDRVRVLAGAALHDAGKVAHPAEMSEPGHQHEAAGRALLLARGVDPAIARFCVTHASWDGADIAIEDLLVALADKLWKGKRDDELERLVLAKIAKTLGEEPWAIFDRLDAICDAIAAGGSDRLARSSV